MKVDIILPNYNGSGLVKKNLPFVIKALEKFNGKVIVVDDGSTPEEKEKLKLIIKEEGTSRTNIKLVDLEKNMGYSSAVNAGVWASDAEFIVLLNTDILPKEDFLVSLIEKLEKDEDVFAIGCMDESVEGERIVLRGRGIAKWSKGMLVHSRGEVDKESNFWASGGSSIFRHELYKILGGMDKIYNPFYWEDIDLSYRAQKAGYKVLFDKDSVVKHFHEEGAIKSNFKGNEVTTIAYRNQFIFIWKNITDANLMINHVLYLSINIIRALINGDGPFLKGFFLALTKLPVIMDKRKKQKKYNKIPDIEIINRIT